MIFHTNLRKPSHTPHESRAQMTHLFNLSRLICSCLNSYRHFRRMQHKTDPPPLVRPVVICGPSGAGKGTLLNKLLHDFPHKFAKAITHTTRKPRTNEIPGVHYHFTTREEMEKQIKNGEFIESAEIHGNLYGSSIKAVRDVALQGKTCLLEIDVQVISCFCTLI
jgi:hypothetical protein